MPEFCITIEKTTRYFVNVEAASISEAEELALKAYEGANDPYPDAEFDHEVNERVLRDDGDVTSGREEIFAGWTHADAAAAFAEGWNINECGDRQLVIFKDADAVSDLADNEAAHALVERRAAEGSDLHRRALAVIAAGEKSGVRLSIDAITALHNARGALSSLLDQVGQMRGMFNDEDGTIQLAVDDADEADAEITAVLAKIDAIG